MGKFRAQIDGLQDGDGHFEVAGSGAEARLKYRLDPPYDRLFEFIEPLDEVAARVEGRAFGRGAAGSGLSAVGLFAIHTWEAALTAKEGDSEMRLVSYGVLTCRPGQDR